MNKCPECNKHVKQYMATHIGDTVKRYFRCDKCMKVFVEVLDSPNGYGGVLVDTLTYNIKKDNSYQSKLI